MEAYVPDRAPAEFTLIESPTHGEQSFPTPNTGMLSCSGVAVPGMPALPGSLADPLAFAMVPLVLLAIATLASYLPVRRASRLAA
jgi:ABC-type lipoprotein release transport system permease subunit